MKTLETSKTLPAEPSKRRLIAKIHLAEGEGEGVAIHEIKLAGTTLDFGIPIIIREGEALLIRVNQGATVEVYILVE